ncbi:PIF1-like helicase domain-containing protein [Hirsutella rhossiliensis]|uniref:ATP-dependent DNA helicase n=1 Tax=Hirsutella rhossiliensis TaxID=111463 RepID=A0A9P8ML55_9HYPO|nr:PIF1-like helicase domain-containing protein [Hirsutella rhossiliensis]KAH0957203.1 PIF1-like helicase domain-containing protein [Hirsutella rhossiliensis]
MKERLSNDQTWCTPIPHDRKVSTVRDFYQAFHDASTLPIRTCMTATASGLTLVEEKLVSLNSCYGHVKGHITVFPNNVQELATRCSRTPLQALDEIHVSWQGVEKPAPSDLSSLLSVRRRVVERALVWLKRSNPHYAEIEIDVAEMESWGDPIDGVPALVYDRMERNEPSAWEKTRTAHVVPPTERAMDDEGSVEIEELFALLNQRQETGGEAEGHGPNEEGAGRDGVGASPDQNVRPINELRFACDAVGAGADDGRAGPRTLAEEAIAEAGRPLPTCEAPVELLRQAAAGDIVSSRSLNLRIWADIVLRRHGGRFALHHIFAFLVFNMGVRSRNRRVSMLSVARKDFGKVERVARSMTAQRSFSGASRCTATGNPCREVRLNMRRKIQSLIVGYGVPAIWFTINPNDITNPVKLRLAAYRTRDPGAAEEFLEGLGSAYKRTRLAMSDPMSAAVFFHREMKLFFDHYVKVGEESVFGRIGKYYGAVETNERGALHVHGLLWLHGNAHLSSMLADIHGEDQAAYRERIIRYVDSVFSEDLDQEGFCAVQAERSIRRTHSMVNRWNKAIAVGLRHNHDISFIATQRKTMALMYYVTNYATKVEDPVWKCGGRGRSPGRLNGTRQFLMRVANRVFTERPLSQVEVVAHLLGYPAEFTNSSAWAYLNTSLLYWEVFRRWPYLRRASGAAAIDDTLDESVLRRPGKHATVCLDGYLSKDFGHNDDEESCHRRAAVQHLALFVPWESFLCEETGEINSIWERAREALAPRISCLVDNVQLLRRSAEDAKRDAKQWAASSGDGDSTVAHVEEGETGEAGAEFAATYRSNNIGDATRLIDVVRGAVGTNQVTAKSPELMAMMRQLCRFQQSALCSTAELEAIAIPEQGLRCISMPGRVFSGAALPPQDQVKAIKSQQINQRHHDPPACGFTKDQGAGGANTAKDLDGVRLTKRAERFIHGQSRMDWQEKDVLVIDEVSMLGARTLHAINERLCRLRGSQKDFGGIPIVLFCGDFQQFRPVQERSIVLPSAAISWDVDNSFKAEQRHQHDKAHALWKRFTTRIRQGVQDRTDLDLLNSRCYREGRRIPWETGITVVTPLNRNRWNLNMEASLAFRVQQRSTMRIFISEHKWKEGLPTEEEAIMILNQGDDSAIPVPAVFMFVAGMPVVVNHNTHQGLKLVNGAGYSAVEVIVDKASPGHRISSDMTIHFGRRRGYYWNRRRQRTSTSSGCRRARSC